MKLRRVLPVVIALGVVGVVVYGGQSLGRVWQM